MKIPYTIDLQDKTVVITGGSGVLCGCMAQAINECGAKIAILAIDDSAHSMAAELNRHGGRALGVVGNVMDRASLDRARDEINQQLGSCDILINGAGGNNPRATTSMEVLAAAHLQGTPAEDQKTFFDLTGDGVSMVFGLNFLGTFLTTQVFARDMAAKEHGCIINISSMSAFCPLTKIPAYSAAKAAIDNFTRWLAVHLAAVNVRVNAIAPGFFLTAQNKSLLTNPDGSLTARSAKILSQTPMNRFGQPEELLGTLLWLLSDDAAGFVTGTVIPVDGGFSAYSGV